MFLIFVLKGELPLRYTQVNLPPLFVWLANPSWRNCGIKCCRLPDMKMSKLLQYKRPNHPLGQFGLQYDCQTSCPILPIRWALPVSLISLFWAFSQILVSQSFRCQPPIGDWVPAQNRRIILEPDLEILKDRNRGSVRKRDNDFRYGHWPLTVPSRTNSRGRTPNSGTRTDVGGRTGRLVLNESDRTGRPSAISMNLPSRSPPGPNWKSWPIPPPGKGGAPATRPLKRFKRVGSEMEIWIEQKAGSVQWAFLFIAPNTNKIASACNFDYCRFRERVMPSCRRARPKTGKHQHQSSGALPPQYVNAHSESFNLLSQGHPP